MPSSPAPPHTHPPVLCHATEAGRFLHTGGAPSVAGIGAAGRSAPGQEEPGEAAFLKAADKLMGDLGTSGDAPFGGEVQLDPESQVGAAQMGRGMGGLGQNKQQACLSLQQVGKQCN